MFKTLQSWVGIALTSLFGMVFAQPLLAQIPTGVPTEIASAFTAGKALIVALGIASIVVLYTASVMKWGRSQT